MGNKRRRLRLGTLSLSDLNGNGEEEVDDSPWQDARDEDVGLKLQVNRLQAKTPNQGLYMKAIETSTITICTGPAGTGKTYMACGIAAQMLRADRIRKVIITRPMVTCGKSFGFLPGDANEKFSPYVCPLMDAFEDFIRPKELEKLIQDKVIELWPLELMRGASIRNALIICDEAQNAEYVQLHMLLTRFADRARVVVTGDTKQTDLFVSGENPLGKVSRRLRGNDDISIVQLTRDDIVRHPLVRWIDERLDESEQGPEQKSVASGTWRDIACPLCSKKPTGGTTATSLTTPSET